MGQAVGRRGLTPFANLRVTEAWLWRARAGTVAVVALCVVAGVRGLSLLQASMGNARATAGRAGAGDCLELGDWSSAIDNVR